MREIKFRAWDKEFRKMLRVTELHFHIPLRVISGFELIDWDEDYSADYHQGDNFIIMQYTDLKDKNGKEIYEGDIVTVIKEFGEYEEDRMPLTTCVAKLYGWGSVFAWNAVDCDGEHIERSVDMGSTYQLGLEVIGNIYENPELIEEG